MPTIRQRRAVNDGGPYTQAPSAVQVLIGAQNIFVVVFKASFFDLASVSVCLCSIIAQDSPADLPL